MKKRRIMATITAVAMAVAGFIVPASERNVFNIETDAIYYRGGIHLSKPLPITSANITKILDPNSEEYKFATAVSVGDEIQMNIFVPDLGVDLSQVQLEVQYDSRVFQCTQWYRDGSEPSSLDFKNDVDVIGGYTKDEVEMMEKNNWPTISTFGSDSDVSWLSTFKEAGDDENKKRLRISTTMGTAGSDPVVIKAFNGINSYKYEKPTTQTQVLEPDGDYSVLVAKFQVKEDVSDATRFITSLFQIKEHLFYSVPTDFGSGEDQWDPDNNEAACYITGRIEGTLTKCSSAYDKDRKEDLYIHVGFDAAVLAWYENEGVPVPKDDIKVNDDGSFVIRGLLPGYPCTLTVHTWCLDDSYTLTDLSSMVYDDFEWELWLYGDVNHDGIIAADDVTQMLRYIVRKPSVFKKSTDDDYDQEEETNRLKAANVTYETGIGLNDNDKVVNVLDATQILRFVCGWIGNDNTSKSVFTIHSNKYLYEAYTDHAGEDFPGKTYITA